MQDILAGVVFIFAEAGAILLLLFAYLLWKVIKKNIQNKKHVMQFMQNYNEHKSENTASIATRLETGCNIDRETAEKVLTNINASERRLYKRILNLALGREQNNLFDIQSDMNGLTDGWIDAIKAGIKNTGVGGESKLDKAHLNKQNEFLKSENARISDNYLHVRSRLQTAVELLENLVKEYSMLYSEGESNEIVEAIEEELNEMKKSMQEADDKVGQEKPEES